MKVKLLTILIFVTIASNAFACTDPPEVEIHHNTPTLSIGVNQRIYFDGTFSLPYEGGTIEEYIWTLAGTVVHDPYASFVFDTPGSYQLYLTVTDDLSQTNTDSVIICVNCGSLPPRAVITTNQSIIYPKSTVSFSASNIVDRY